MIAWVFVLAPLPLLWWAHRAACRYDDRHSALARAMRRITDALDRTAVTIAFAFTPAVREAIVALNDMAEAFKRTQEIADTDIGDLVARLTEGGKQHG